MSAQHTPGRYSVDDLIGATTARRSQMLRQERTSHEADIVIAMRNEVQAAAEERFGELAFLWRHAEDLNLNDPEDRGIFRSRVAERLKFTTVEAMREWVPEAGRDRYSAARAVADAFIAKAAGGAA